MMERAHATSSTSPSGRREQLCPPTRNLSDPDPAVEGLDLVGGNARPLAMEYPISNGFGFGFGGVNASALFRRWG